ncbi:helix-turn-helix domain-containing protein [Nocardioides humi]|uniref:helix-turn-helix domain-containing protein n=1 Tax=Nocardioides humi TaxID=449461 RepID=UPI0015E843CB|nr:helix-turn-helix domain-containing protein [Nocardioides humi]
MRVIEHAARINNVSEACRIFGVSRKTYYEWIKKAEQYGLSALLPRDRRTPHQPNAMSSEEVAVIVSEAIARPTLGPKSLLRHLKKRGVDRSASGVAKVLRRHNLGTAKQRVIALASLTATATGQLIQAALEGPFGFCQYASRPGQVVALDAFYVGRLKGVGAVWQLTAVDIATRIAVVQLVVGDKTAAVAAKLLDHLKKALRRHGITLEGVLTDNGPEFVGRAFQARVGELGLHHHRIPPRSPNHNAVCERFHGTVLDEFYRPHFHRGRVEDIALLDRSLQAWVRDYNEERPNNGDYMRGRTPRQVKKDLRGRTRQTAA